MFGCWGTVDSAAAGADAPRLKNTVSAPAPTAAEPI